MVKARQGASTLPKDPAPLPGSAEPPALLMEADEPLCHQSHQTLDLEGDKSCPGHGCSSDTVERCLPKPLLGLYRHKAGWFGTLLDRVDAKTVSLGEKGCVEHQ